MSVPWYYRIIRSLDHPTFFSKFQLEAHSISNACCLADQTCSFRFHLSFCHFAPLRWEDGELNNIPNWFYFSATKSRLWKLWHKENSTSQYFSDDRAKKCEKPHKNLSKFLRLGDPVWSCLILNPLCFCRLSSASWNSIKSCKMLLRSAAKSSHLLRFKAQT